MQSLCCTLNVLGEIESMYIIMYILHVYIDISMEYCMCAYMGTCKCVHACTK